MCLLLVPIHRAANGLQRPGASAMTSSNIRQGPKTASWKDIISTSPRTLHRRVGVVPFSVARCGFEGLPLLSAHGYTRVRYDIFCHQDALPVLMPYVHGPEIWPKPWALRHLTSAYRAGCLRHLRVHSGNDPLNQALVLRCAESKTMIIGSSACSRKEHPRHKWLVLILIHTRPWAWRMFTWPCADWCCHSHALTHSWQEYRRAR